MKVKSYFSRTVEEAMAMARQELGADAMLVNTRRSLPEAIHLGDYEVVFAMHEPSAEAEFRAASPAAPPQASEPPRDRLSLEVADLKRELEGMRRALTRSTFAQPQWLGAPPDLSDAYSILTANDVNPELAREIVQGAESRTGGSRPRGIRPAQRPDADAFQRALVEELGSRFSSQPMLGTADAAPRIAALVGPPGAGKTTTLVKLAVNYGLVCRRPVMLLSADTFRIGAAEQLRSYASILGVGFQVAETATALSQAIEEHRGKELILIDTPGLGLADIEDSSSLSHFLATRPDIDTHLVLSSSMKSADLSRMVDRYEVFQPQRLLFTKLDETISFGPILNESARTGKALSFFANGQRIPEDIEAATQSRLVNLVLTGETGKARSAA